MMPIYGRTKISKWNNILQGILLGKRHDLQKGDLRMFKCAWCMKKIPEDQPLSAINVRFVEGVDYKDVEGEIIQVYLKSRNTSVPMIVTTEDSEAKKHGQDGLFAVCDHKCGDKMKAALAKEVDTFKNFLDAEL
ncbi:hypothetical protein ACUL41_16895 [Virgibacillus natechei]